MLLVKTNEASVKKLSMHIGTSRERGQRGGVEAGRGERGDRVASLLGSTDTHLGLLQQRGVPRGRGLCAVGDKMGGGSSIPIQS